VNEVLREYRFRPRYRGLAVLSIAVAMVVAVATALSVGLVAALIIGFIGVLFGVGYFASPMFRYVVVVDDDHLEVRSRSALKFSLRWAEVVGVTASPQTKTCFVSGGSPDNSLLVPGDGAPAPYRIAEQAELYQHIVSRVSPDKIIEVDSLDSYSRSLAPS
jgi:hypothetical protein